MPRHEGQISRVFADRRTRQVLELFDDLPHLVHAAASCCKHRK